MTPDIPDSNHKMCFPWKLCSEGQQIPSLLHCFIDVYHLKWDTSECFCLPFRALLKCFQSTAPVGIRFLLCSSVSSFFPLGRNSSALFNPGKTRKWELLERGVEDSSCLSWAECLCAAPAHHPSSSWANGEREEFPGGHSPHSERTGWERCEEPHELRTRSTTVGLRKRKRLNTKKHRLTVRDT